VSLPKGKSFNDNINSSMLEKVNMTSAHKFGFAILRAGKDSIMLKFDKIDAYKNVPAKIQDLNYQGFMWGGRYFMETRQMFGSKASVQNYDILGNTIVSLVLSDCKILRKQVLRQLDDTPAVAPRDSGWSEEFSMKYKSLCKDINLELADPCPNFDKAFDCSTKGKVLGVFFDTTELSWKLPDEKVVSILQTIAESLENEKVQLKQMQCLMGKLNHVAQMCPFLNSFKHPLNLVLADCLANNTSSWSSQAIRDLKVWTAFLLDLKNGMPIPQPNQEPPLCTKTFHSDAAGFPKNGTWEGDIGCGLIGTDESGNTLLAFQLWWPKEMVTSKKDSKGSSYGCKTTTLEMVGVLLPFLLMPSELKGQHVVVRVDNMACVYGWANHYLKGDISASILIRALHLISAFLGSIIHVEHVPRRSSWESSTADNLSRRATTGFLEEQMLGRFRAVQAPKVLTDWLMNPQEDWAFANDLLAHVICSSCVE
jgi:hypothetical protein